MEVESVPVAQGWEARTAIAAYSGTSYYEWLGPRSTATASANGTMMRRQL